MSGALAIGATSVMVLCIVLGLFLDGAVTLLLFGVAATLATYLVLISGSFVVDDARRRQPPGRGGLTRVMATGAERIDRCRCGVLRSRA